MGTPVHVTMWSARVELGPMRTSMTPSEPSAPRRDNTEAHNSGRSRVVVIESPVMFPPGRDKLLISPDPTGSGTRAMTIGIVEVARLAASVPTVLSITITATLLRMNSSTNAGTRP